MTEKKTKKLKPPENEQPAAPATKINTDTQAAPVNNLTDPGLKSSLYARVLDEAEKLDFKTASSTEGLDDEIALMRLKIKTLLETNPDDVHMLVEVTDMLVKLVKTRNSMNKKQEKNLGEAITKIIRDIGVPLGVSVLNKKL